MDVRLAHENEADLPWSWAHILQAQLLGEDPTSGWRALVVAGVRAGRGVDVSPAMPAAFVLQWSLEVAAEAGLYAESQLRGIHDPVDSGLTFAVHPTQGYPTGARFRALSAAPPPAAADGVDLVSANLDTYRRAAVELAESYHPGVNLGRQQRTEMVADVSGRGRRATPRTATAGPPVMLLHLRSAGRPRVRRLSRRGAAR